MVLITQVMTKSRGHADLQGYEPELACRLVPHCVAKLSVVLLVLLSSTTSTTKLWSLTCLAFLVCYVMRHEGDSVRVQRATCAQGWAVTGSTRRGNVGTSRVPFCGWPQRW